MAIAYLTDKDPQYKPTDIRRYTRRYLAIATLAAILLHVIGIGLVFYTPWLDRPEMTAIRLVPYEKLEKPPPLAADQLEIIEVPERSRTPERPMRPTPLRADKNAIARNSEVKPLDEGLPYSEGDTEIKTLDEPGAEAQHDMAIESPGYGLPPRSGGMDDFRDAEDIPVWSPDLMLRPEWRGKQHGDFAGKDRVDRYTGSDIPHVIEHSTGPAEIVRVPIDDLDERPKPTIEDELEAAKRRNPGKFGFSIGNPGVIPKYNNQASVARDFGDFSFSTIQWDYAPYLYALRRRVYRNWYPPPAFFMGLVSGRVIVRFKIMRNGQLRDFEIRSYRDDRAYQALVASSENAIKGSSPFPPLPNDFPDPFLEISATFFYRILGEE